MAIYKISELMNSLKSALSDGYEYVEISVLTDDEDDSEPETLSLYYVETAHDGETDMIDSVTLPSGYIARLKQ